MNRNIGEDVLSQIMNSFGLTEKPKVHYDGSKHYECHLD